MLAAISLSSGLLAAQSAYPGQELGGGLGFPAGIALDSTGNIYVADFENDAVKEIPAGCQSSACTVVLGGRITGPEGVALDGKGNIYVASSFGLYQMAVSCEQSSCMNWLSSYAAATGLAFDSSGNLYVTQKGSSNYSIYKVASSCIASACLTQLGAVSSSQLDGVAVDTNGNVFVVDYTNNVVDKISPGCTSSSCVTALGGGFTQPKNVALDAGGNAYITDGSYGIWELPVNCTPASCALKMLSPGDGPNGIALDAKGNIYFSATSSGSLGEWLRTAVNAGSLAVNSTGAIASVSFVFNGSGTIAAPAVLTQGATKLDFTDAGTGTCTTNGSSHSYNSGDTCTVSVQFSPEFPGTRYGAVVLKNSGGAVIATGYIDGAGAAPEVVFSPSTVISLGGGFNDPLGVTVDAAGNVYVADPENNAVKEMPAGCASSSCVTKLGGGFSIPSDVALDGSGNIYVADAGNNAVKEMPAGCASSACVVTLGAGLAEPSGVAVDAAGNVYVADYGNNAIKELPAGCASSSCLANLGGGFTEPSGVAVDGSGHIYVADSNNNAVKEMPAGCASSSCVTTLGGDFHAPRSVAVDGGGDIYVADYDNDAVKVMPAGCATSSCVFTLGGTFATTDGVALDGSGNVYVADHGDSAVKEMERPMPPSLSFPNTPAGNTSGPQTVTVQNIGNNALSFQAVSYPADFPEASGVDTDCTTSSPVAGGSSCTLSIDFTPLASSLKGLSTLLSESVSLTDNNGNAANATQSVAVSGTETGVVPALTSPTTSPIAGSVTFAWNPGAGSSMFALWIGTSGAGAKDLYSSGDVANTVTSATVSIPANGVKLYVRLWYEVSSTWKFTDYTFIEALAPTLTSPASSPLSGATKFSWNAGTGSSMFALWIGTGGAGTKDLYTSGHVSNSVTSETVNIPASGVKLYVRLWYEISGAWFSRDYTFTESTAPFLANPTSSPLFGPTQFVWNPGTNTSMFALWIGTAQGSYNLYTSGHVANSVTSETVNIPANGATLYVRLWYEISNAWQFTDYIFTEAQSPTLTSPTSSPLAGATKFAWNPGNAASMFALWVGTTQGSYNIYTSGHVANTITFENVNIPSNGATVYVRLWYLLNSSWDYVDYTFTEAQ